MLEYEEKMSKMKLKQEAQAAALRDRELQHEAEVARKRKAREDFEVGALSQAHHATVNGALTHHSSASSFSRGRQPKRLWQRRPAVPEKLNFSGRKSTESERKRKR